MRHIHLYWVTLFALMFAVSTSVPGFAEGTARLVGTVTDTSNAILPGAKVEIQNNGSVVKSTVSDSQGQFTLPNVAPGTYTLAVSYIGFTPFEKPVMLTAGKTTTISAVLNVASEGENVIVTAERAHGEAESINESRVADNILNVLPSTVIRSLPNANVADAVGRLPGVTLERDEGEGKYVQIRGTEPRLSNLTIDGVEVPSPEGGVRQVKLDVIPTGLVDSVQINKTLQPNLNGDAIGGSVNLVTKKAGDQPTLSLYGLGGFTPIANTRSVYEFGGTAGKRFGANNKLGVMVSGSYDYNGRGIDDIEPVPSVIQPTPGGPWTYDITGPAFRQYLYDRKRYGFGGSLDYRLSQNTNIYVHSLYSDFKDNGDRYEYVFGTNDTGIPGSNIPGPFTTERRNPDFQVASLSVGANHVFGTSLLNWQFAVARSRMLNPIGGGESHTLFSYLQTQSNCQYLASQTTNPYLPVFSPACYSEAYNPSGMQLSQIQDSAHGMAAQLNLEGTVSYAKNYHVGSHTSTFETGFYIRNAHKSDDSYEVDYCPRSAALAAFPNQFLASSFLSGFHNSNYYNGHYPYGPGISWEKVQSYLAANPNNFSSNPNDPTDPCAQTYPQGGNSNNFDLVERVTAGYIMDSINFSRFRLVGGIRFEGTQDDTLSFDNSTGIVSFPGHGSYISILPSVSLKVRLDSKDNSALRFVYARGLSRPDPMFLTSATSLDTSTTPYTLTVGNPTLKPEHGDSFDVLYERYLTPLGLLQGGFFYKRLTGPIISVLSGPRPIFGCPTPTCYVNSSGNGGDAYITGLELSFQQHFTYLPGWMKGLGVLANYSYATSKAHNVSPGLRVDSPALLRQAPNTWNISPTYDRGRLSVRVGMAYNGANIYSYFFKACAGSGENVNPDGSCPNGDPTPGGVNGPFGDYKLYSHFQVDAQGSVYMGKGFTALVSALNLNNEVFGFYYGSTPYFTQREYYQPTYSFGLRWDLGHEK